MQLVRKRLAARRATAGLAVAHSREHNNADNRFLAGPEGTPQIGQCRVANAPTFGAVLVKDMPFPADCASPKAPTVGALARFGTLCIQRYLIEGVLGCSFVYNDKPSFGIRLWENGGLFAGTGIFWNKKYGIFRAYVTTGSKSHLVLVDTPATRVVITPKSPDQFVAHGK